MAFFLDFEAANGVPFRARIVRPGEARCGGLINRNREAMVEVFDRRYPEMSDFFGQFVMSYYASSLVAMDPSRGLAMDCGIPDWQLDPASAGMLRAFAIGAAA